ncbi:MAG: hypothetical protein DRQ10_07585 [Candidatus Hydrothermota bacterium]|nr:MAG: hypothetical protein DRQ10_07585 [Candidatus Hydrothermae bacterium]
MRKGIGALGAAILGIILFFVAAHFVSQQFGRCEFRIIDIRIDSLDIFHSELKLDLMVINPSDLIPAFASSIRYAITTDHDTLGQGIISGPISVMPGDTAFLHSYALVRNDPRLMELLYNGEGRVKMKIYIIKFLGLELTSNVSVRFYLRQNDKSD